MDALPQLQLTPIGWIETPFKEKFGIPRQNGLVPAAEGVIHLEGAAAAPDCVDGLAGFSHLWLLWYADALEPGDWQPKVRPPRLGGNKKIGVFASRSVFRPNPVGLSVVKLEAIETVQNQICLRVSGVDMRHGTPILDIKPYLPYADAVPEAKAGYAPHAPEPVLEVQFAPPVAAQLASLPQGEHVADLLRQVLALDPRPAYRQQQNGRYAMRLAGWDVQWQVSDQALVVLALVPLSN